MPIEIKELHLKVKVGGSQKEESQAQESTETPDIQEIVEQCVEEVLEILKHKSSH